MTLQELVKSNFSNLFFDNNHKSIYGKYHIRFELGGELKNGTKKRVKQVVERAIEIFNQTIDSEEVLIVIEEYKTEFFDRNGNNKEYLYSLINKSKLKRFEGPFEQTYFETDSEGNRNELLSEDKLECDLLIGKMFKSDLKSKEIIEGIANLEMGFEPYITQDIVFFCPLTTNALNIYDDRGCDVWSNDKEHLRIIYKRLNNWILEYNRKEIDEKFK